MLFYNYFARWMKIYKKPVLRLVSYKKYEVIQRHIKQIAPKQTLDTLDRQNYQKIINEYAKTHAKQTTLDFHNVLKACLLDALDEGDIKRNPCRKISIGGTITQKQKKKYLNLQEAEKLINALNLNTPIKNSYDWMIYLALNTGLRFAEILGLTKSDFNNSILSVSKTFDYKHTLKLENRTKTFLSTRKIVLPPSVSDKFEQALKTYDDDELVFIGDKKIYNSTANDYLFNLCTSINITPISFHGLRHTHASILLYNDVSIHSISKRLGHARISITQDRYAHLINELKTVDDEKIKMALTSRY